jgi:tellurite resistance protein
MQRAGGRADQGTALHLTANLFAVPFGLAGLTQAWSAVTQLAGASDWPGNVLWIVTAVTWLVTLGAYVANVAAARRWKTELSDPTFGPSTALIVIVPMLLGVRLAQQARGAGEVMFWCSAILLVLAGAWITGDWITGDGGFQRWHPGYFLPTSAGGLLAGGASAALGFTTLSHLLFGLGFTSFVVLASIISARLYLLPSLPPPLWPTIAIDLAPSVVAGDSWFAINGGRVDTPETVLGGLSLLMLLVQFRLIPLYRRAQFGPGFWAFSFPFAATVTYGVHWLAAEHVRGGPALTYALVGVLTAGFALLAARTISGLIQGTFLPRVPAAAQAIRLTCSTSQAGGELRDDVRGRLWLPGECDALPGPHRECFDLTGGPGHGWRWLVSNDGFAGGEVGDHVAYSWPLVVWGAARGFPRPGR